MVSHTKYSKNPQKYYEKEGSRLVKITRDPSFSTLLTYRIVFRIFILFFVAVFMGIIVVIIYYYMCSVGGGNYFALCLRFALIRPFSPTPLLTPIKPVPNRETRKGMILAYFLFFSPYPFVLIQVRIMTSLTLVIILFVSCIELTKKGSEALSLMI